MEKVNFLKLRKVFVNTFSVLPRPPLENEILNKSPTSLSLKKLFEDISIAKSLSSEDMATFSNMVEIQRENEIKMLLIKMSLM